MKIIFILLFALIAVSCGRPSGSNDGISEVRQEEAAQGETHRSYDLMNVTMGEPVEISGNQIIFKTSKTVSDYGDRLSCILSVSAGDVYQYSVAGNSLQIQQPDGSSYTLQREGAGSSVLGIWSGVKKENQMQVFRRYTILENQIIMNMNCEG